ncbi:MAG: hypothetical protein QM774_05005 [Gordonia sp. (in: high G+C Gram-positive bacteria)]|uniref:hypothetical protein n=1 Tax=Gordonia sp. (in: high G+C Gram-positive bacteria) TaxID=84139 RepID=UPI0039E72908
MAAATGRGRGILAAIVVVLLLALGAGVASVVGDALGIRAEPAQPMGGEPAPATTVGPPVSSPRFDLTGDIDSPRLRVAGDELAAAQDSTTTAGTGQVTVVHRSAAGDDETYRVTGTPTDLHIDADGEAGAARAVYDLAHAIRARTGVTSLIGRTVTSRLPFRMADLGAVGVTPDPAQWRDGTDYSHASKAFADVFLANPPYIDQKALDAAYDDFDHYLRRILAEGYNALAFPGFIEFVTFDGLGVYPPGDPHIAKATALRDAFSRFWNRARELGMKVYLRTDMLTLTTPLEKYLTRRFGSLDTTDPALWDVYSRGLDELYRAEPALDGVLIRIGEAGRVYDVPGWDYYSDLAVTTPSAVRAMLTALTGQAERTGREVIFRSWSVGVGAVGDMHTDPDSYREVLDGIDSPALIVSTKYTLGDFYSWLPLNDTLLQGRQRRIVEFQSRREFENGGAFPDDLGAQYRWALQRLLAANPGIEGIWSWTQDGGPWRAGPMILYDKTGFWQLADLNSRLAADLARNPDADPSQVTLDWIREWFSDDPQTARSIADAMAESRQAIEQGLYIPPYAQQRVSALGLEPPPMMWIFEWDILTGDSAALDVIYRVSRDRLDEAIAGGAQAVQTVAHMRDTVAGTDPSTWRDPAMRTAFVSALDYEHSTLTMLADYRAMVLHDAAWRDTGSAAQKQAWRDARTAFAASSADHLKRYSGDVDHPAYNLTAADLGMRRADRNPAMAWAARILLVVAAVWLILGLLRRVRPARATLTAALVPWRAEEAAGALGRHERILLLAVPAVLLVATRAAATSVLSWTHLALTLGAWAVFCAVVLIAVRKRSVWTVIAVVGGVAVLRCVLVLFALSWTGPGGYWFAFWTEPAHRAAYITVAVALYAWTFVAVGWALAARWGRRRATGLVLAAAGTGLAVPAAVVAAVGLERVLTAWNDQMGLLPWGLSRILGITVYLGIPPALPLYAVVAGAVLLVVGAVLALPFGARRTTRS